MDGRDRIILALSTRIGVAEEVCRTLILYNKIVASNVEETIGHLGGKDSPTRGAWLKHKGALAKWKKLYDA